MKQFSTRRPDTRRRVNRLYTIAISNGSTTQVYTWSRKQAEKIVNEVYRRPIGRRKGK